MKTLFKNRWLHVRELDVTLPGGEEAKYTSVLDGSGASIAVLPFQRQGDGTIRVLLREEITPPWLTESLDPHERVLSSLTGMVDAGESPFKAAVRELYEEAGYQVDDQDMIPLGYVRVSKVLEGKVFLYAVDVTGMSSEEPPGDGGPFEPYARSVWCDMLMACVDGLAWVLWAKLQAHIGGRKLVLPPSNL